MDAGAFSFDFRNGAITAAHKLCQFLGQRNSVLSENGIFQPLEALAQGRARLTYIKLHVLKSSVMEMLSWPMIFLCLTLPVMWH
jgi:hypothetical protein